MTRARAIETVRHMSRGPETARPNWLPHATAASILLIAATRRARSRGKESPPMFLSFPIRSVCLCARPRQPPPSHRLRSRVSVVACCSRESAPMARRHFEPRRRMSTEYSATNILTPCYSGLQRIAASSTAMVLARKQAACTAAEREAYARETW